MKSRLTGIALGVVAVLVVVGFYVMIRQDIRREADESRATADRVAERLERAARDGLQGGIHSGVETVENRARQIPREVLNDILSMVGGGEASPPQTERGPQTRDSKSSNGLILPIPRGPFTPQTVVQDVVKFGRQAAQQVDNTLQDLLPLTDKEEMELGAKSSQLFLASHRQWDSPETQARLQDLADPLLEKRQRRDIQYTIVLLDDPDINASALPGGRLFFNRGLIEFAQSNAELQFVIAHEIGHVDLKHCVRSYTHAVQAGKLGGQPVEMAVLVLHNQYELAFSEENEFEADAYALRRMLALAVPKEDILAFHRRFRDHKHTQGETTSQPDPASVPDAIRQEIENHFRTHPCSDDRIRRLEEIIVSTKLGN